MTYEQFLTEVNLLTTTYEVDRQKLADKYQQDIHAMHDSTEAKKAKLFETYKKAQKDADKKIPKV